MKKKGEKKHKKDVVIEGGFPRFLYFKSNIALHLGPKKTIYEDCLETHNYLKTLNLA